MDYKPSIRDQMQYLNRRIEEVEDTKKKKEKGFKIPRRGRLKKKDLKKGYVTVQTIGENNAVEFTKHPIEEGTIMVNGSPYLATAEYILNHKNKPFMILPLASVEPYRPSVIEDEIKRNQTRAAGFRLILNRMKSEQIKTKNPISWGTMILIGGALAIGIWYITTHKIF